MTQGSQRFAQCGYLAAPSLRRGVHTVSAGRLHLRRCFITAGAGVGGFLSSCRQPDIKACAGVNEVAQGCRRGCAEQQLSCLGFSGPAEANQVLLDPAVDAAEGGAPLRQILAGGVMAGAQPVKLRHSVPQGQHFGIDADAFQFGSQALDFVVQRRAAGHQSGLFIAKIADLFPPLRRHLGQVLELVELALQTLQFTEARPRRQQTVDRRQPDPKPLSLGTRRIVARRGVLKRLGQLGIFAGLGVDALALGFQIGQFGLEFSQPAFLRSRFVEFLGLGAQPDKLLRQIAKPGAGGEQQFAQIAATGEDALAALFEGLVIEREHRPVAVAAKAAETGNERRLGERLVAAIEQAVLRALDADEFAGFAVQLDCRADAHGRVGMQEIVAALRADAEQQVEPAIEQGGFAGLVGAIDNVQVAAAIGPRSEIDDVIGELAVACQIEAVEAHQAVSLAGPVAGPPCSRASTSSAPSRARFSSVCAVRISSVPSRSRSSGGS